MIGPYDTAYAFRSALEARLRNVAEYQGTDLQRLRRRVAFDRLLARLFAEDEPPWLLKGGYALELRLHDRARATVDLDIAVVDPACLALVKGGAENVSYAEAVQERLQEAAARDLRDGFSFIVGRLRTVQTGVPGGVRCSVESRLAGRTFAQFRVDVGLGDSVVGPADWVAGSALLS